MTEEIESSCRPVVSGAFSVLRFPFWMRFRHPAKGSHDVSVDIYRSSGCDEAQFREIRSIASGVACEKGHARDGRVRADEEIRKRARFLSPSPTILAKCFG